MLLHFRKILSHIALVAIKRNESGFSNHSLDEKESVLYYIYENIFEDNGFLKMIFVMKQIITSPKAHKIHKLSTWNIILSHYFE